MGRELSSIVRLILPCVALVGCGGKDKKPVKKPVVKVEKPKEPPKETEAEREAKRHQAALEIVPEGSTCFPPSLKEEGAPRLELAAINKDAVICAIDVDSSRLLGTVGCWKVGLGDGSLSYQTPNPLPGRNVDVKLDDRCARGYCIPKDAKIPDNKIVHMATSPDGTKVVVISGDDAHIYDASARSRESGFSIRGDNGVTNNPSGVEWVGNSIFIEGTDEDGTTSHVFQFRTDGQAVGGLMALGGKQEVMLDLHKGSFLILDEGRVAIAEKGFTTVTSFEVVSGKRAKTVRKISNGACKKADIEQYWKGGDGEPSAKCKAHLKKTFAHLIGADAVAGKTNLLALLRGPRLGELAVLDVRSLGEKKAIKLPWCAAGAEADGEAPDNDDAKRDKAKPKKKPAKAERSRKSPKKAADDEAEDPDAGGE